MFSNLPLVPLPVHILLKKPNPLSLSVVRVVGLKVAVVCLLSVLVCVSSADKLTIRTCGLSAAIAFASALHAYVLFGERQSSCEDEVRVDALRTSEFSVTLVLQSLLLTSVAEFADASSNNILSTHAHALLQTVIVLMFVGARVTKFKLSFLLSATALWTLTTVDMLLLVGWPFNKAAEQAREAASVIWAVSLVGLAYPIVRLTVRTPVRKDVIYGVLDGFCRGGVGLFCCLRATSF